MTDAVQLNQTSSLIRLRGIVSGLDKENAYRAGQVQSGKHKGKEYRSIKFLLNTSPENRLKVEKFGMEQDYVYPFRKEDKKKKIKKDTKKLPFAKRFNIPEGYDLIGSRVALELDENEKAISKNMTDYDAVDEIWENLNDGDSVYIKGYITYNSYETDNGDLIEENILNIVDIYREKPIDFEDPKFEEMCVFEQEFVFVDSEVDEEQKAVFVNGYQISYGNKFNPIKFVVRMEEDKPELRKLAAGFTKTEFGDVITLAGQVLNRAETIEVEVEGDNEVEDLFGSGVETKGMTTDTVTTYTKELRGLKVLALQRAVYTDDDFVEDELMDEEDEFEDENGNELFGDISDDDLPF